MAKLKRYSISLSQRNLEQVKALIEYHGYASISETVRVAISQTYNDTYPTYKGGGPLEKANRQEAKQTPEEKREAKAQTLKEESYKVCDALNGLVVKDPVDGTEACHFFQYTSRDRHLQSISVDDLTEDWYDMQYQPSKERVDELIKNGTVNYDLKKTLEDEIDEAVAKKNKSNN